MNAHAVNFAQAQGLIAGVPISERRLSNLDGCFADTQAYTKALTLGDTLVYGVASMEPAQGPGDLHYGMGIIYPGRIGAEYYMTKGHLHAWRPAAEVYIGLSGEGMMLLEDEQTGESRLLPLVANSIVYVPGSTAHRTMNTGQVPLTYLGIYPAAAGHDYGVIAERNFRSIVIEQDGKPTLVDRNTFLLSLLPQTAL